LCHQQVPEENHRKNGRQKLEILKPFEEPQAQQRPNADHRKGDPQGNDIARPIFRFHHQMVRQQKKGLHDAQDEQQIPRQPNILPQLKLAEIHFPAGRRESNRRQRDGEFFNIRKQLRLCHAAFQWVADWRVPPFIYSNLPKASTV
jgi:hypothetical protein